MNKAGQPHGEVLGRMKPLSSNSCNWIFNSANSLGVILYGRRDIGAVPGYSSITNSTSRSGGIPGNSSGNTPGYSLTTGISAKIFPLR